MEGSGWEGSGDHFFLWMTVNSNDLFYFQG